MNLKFTIPLLSAIQILCASSAIADASASGALTNISVQVYDLNPYDGVAATAAFSGNAGSATDSIVYQYHGLSGDIYSSTEDDDYKNSSGNFSSSSSSVNFDFGGATAQVSGNAYSSQGATATASSQVKDATADGFNYSASGAGSQYDCGAEECSYSVTLSAHSVFVVSAFGTFSSSVNANSENTQFAHASGQLYASLDDGASSQLSGASLEALTYKNVFGGSSETFLSQVSGYMYVTLVNLTDHALTGMFSWGVYTVANSQAALVPEPSTISLAGVGLLMLLAKSSRRRRNVRDIFTSRSHGR